MTAFVLTEEDRDLLCNFLREWKRTKRNSPILPPSPDVDQSLPRVTYFELKETLTADSTTGATAYRRNWDGTANASEGAFVTDTADANTEFTVKDTREVGYNGSAGAKGACIIRAAENGLFGEIIDMECP